MAKRSDVIDKKSILFRTNNGLDVYKKELNLIKKNGNYTCLCPFHNEKTPSFYIYPNGNFKCFGCSESGDIFSFIMKRYGLKFNEAAKKIDGEFKSAIVAPKIIKPVVEQQKKLLVEFQECKFTKQAHKYWNEYGFSEDFLNKNNVFQVKAVAINKKIWKIPDNAVRFVYFAPDIKEAKFLTIGKDVTKDDKWRSINIPNSYLWFYHEYTSCDNLFISKSVKDALVFKMLGLCSIAVQSENAKVLLKNAEKINKISKNPVVVFGTDDQGKNESIITTKETGWAWFNTKNYLLKYGINDVAEYIKEFGLEVLRTELKQKKLI